MDGNKETKRFGRITMFARWIVSFQAWRQNRKNKNQIDSINNLQKEILEHQLKFLENPFFEQIRKQDAEDRKRRRKTKESLLQ